MAKKWRCTVCGYIHEGPEAPDQCPMCKVGKEKFVEVEEKAGGLDFVTEHKLGDGKGASQELWEGLNNHFMGECSEVGQYLAMARQADREGYPEIAEAFKRYAWEEAEHASKFAELIGDIVWDTKTNLFKRMNAECGACEDKMRLARLAKEQNLDAVHDTVHEMAKDEARHGSGFQGFYNRYFTALFGVIINGDGGARFERPLLLRILFLRYFLSEFPQKTFENGAQDAVQLVGDPVVTRAYDLCHFGDVVELVADVLNGRTYRNQIDDQGDQGENTAQNQRSPDHRAGQLCEPDDEGP